MKQNLNVLMKTKIQKLKQILGILFLVCSTYIFSTAQNNTLNFDGSNDYAEDVNATGFPIGNSPRTVELWFNAEPMTGGNHFLYTYGEEIGIGGAFGVTAANQSGNMRLDFWAGNQDFHINPSTTVPYNQWHHLALVYDGTTMYAYLNGALISSSVRNLVTTGANPLFFGKGYPGWTSYFDGSLDEFRVWDYARCQTEIVSQKDCELSGTEVGLVAYYNFNQGTAGGTNTSETTLSATVGGNDATLINFALLGNSSNWVDGSTNGVSSTTCTQASLPEIDVIGNGQSIVLGDASPTTVDDTDFGSTLTTGNKQTSFTIDNTLGTGALTISAINVTGTNAADFVVSNAPTSIAAGNSATFDVTFSPAATGARTATITVNNNDCNEGVYDFAVEGEGIALGSALHFEGGNDNIDASGFAWAANSGVTVEFWMNNETAGNSDDDVIFAVGGSGANANPTKFWAYMATNNSLYWRYGSTNATHTRPTANTWVHVALVSDLAANEMRHYYDGVLVKTTAAASAPTAPLTGLKIGTSSPWAKEYKGLLDEFRIWNYARCQEEIAAQKDCELLGTEAGLVVYYDFNEGIAAATNAGLTTLADKTSNAYDGTLQTFALTGTTSNWVDGSGNNVSTTTCTPAVLPEIDLAGNGQSIVFGDASPSTADATDFDLVSTTRNKMARFTIDNTLGAAVLTISSINVSGANAGDFAVSNAPTSIAAGNSATFDVTFSPAAAGARTATITVNNNDCNEASYNFAVAGEGVITSTIHVDINAMGANNGSSWANAFTSLQAALDAASTLDEVLIAAGTYLPAKDKTGAASTGRDATFYINKNIIIEGGYPTGGGVQNTMANKTILSGDLGTTSDASDNAYHVVFMMGLSNAAKLEGVYIQDGNANDTSYPNDRGAGIFNDGSSTGNSSPILQNCIVRWNSASIMGGGLLNFSNNGGITSPIITGCLFYENTSAQGASIANSTYLGGSNSMVVSNSTFTDNVGASSIYNRHGNATITVQNSIVWETGGNPIANYGVETTLKYTLINRTSVGPKMIDGGNNIYNINPQFVDAMNDNYSLQAMSIAVAKGSNTLLPNGYNRDLAGTNRPSGATVDLGALEVETSSNPIYVNHAANGTNDGSNWTNAFTDLQTALSVALPSNEIWVAAGTYTPTGGTDRARTFEIREGVRVYGGFVGTETMLNQRNWAVNMTILSGDIGTISDVSDNSYHVVSLKNVNSSTLLDGLVIEHGNSNMSYPNDRGAGIYNDGGNSGNSNPTIQNCVIRWNNAGTMGAGLLNFANKNGNTSSTITGCLFYENTSAQGASIANSTYTGGSNSSIITNSTFADNTGASSIYNPHGNASITIQNSIVWDDNAIHNYANETTVQYSSIKGASLAAGTTDGGNNQLAMNPLFVDAANDDYSLQAASPAIASGNNAYVSAAYILDLAHNTRETGTTVEMGCYEDGANLSRPALVQNEESTNSNTASEEQTLARLEEEMDASSVEVATAAATMSVYPNPVQDMVHINLKDVNQAATVRLLSTTGQVLIQEQVQADAQTVLQLNMGRLAKGMYLLNVQLEDGTQLNERVVKF